MGLESTLLVMILFSLNIKAFMPGWYSASVCLGGFYDEDKKNMVCSLCLASFLCPGSRRMLYLIVVSELLESPTRSKSECIPKGNRRKLSSEGIHFSATVQHDNFDISDIVSNMKRKQTMYFWCEKRSLPSQSSTRLEDFKLAVFLVFSLSILLSLLLLQSQTTASLEFLKQFGPTRELTSPLPKVLIILLS